MNRLTFDSSELRRPLNGLLVQFVNARILRGSKLIADHLWVRDGVIISAEKVFFDERRGPDIQINCQGLILSPGFIDIQINGGFGFDFSTITETDDEYLEGVDKVAKGLLIHGVTSFAPTLITSSPSTYQRVLPLLKRRDGSDIGAGIIGAHLEGPFISPTKKGCHPPQFVNTFGAEPQNKIKQRHEFLVYGPLNNVALITLAPELDGAEEAIKSLVNNGIVVSLGHSAAGLEEGERGIKAGATCITHLFNAMHSYHHRDPGLIGLLTSKNVSRHVHYGIIADGIHTHDSALRLAHRTSPDGLILVTDAIGALGMPEGQHKLGAQTINVKGLSAVLDGTNTTAGSVASMSFCVKHFAKAARCSLEEALIAATKKPAELMNLQNKGNLSIGSDADLVLIDENVNVRATFINGQLVFAS